METTFITIHDLSPAARILYSSDSVLDVLGYQPDEIVNHSCWDYFHPDELVLARAQHDRTVRLDKAAVLSYCRMRDRSGAWVGCEVVFTIVYDVLVGCTTIYSAGTRSRNRADRAPLVRRLFSYSPRDPRYHMLSHLSAKFSASPKASLHEPRAALVLNRYTRTLTIMYATDGLQSLLNMTGDQMCGRSFYYCIAEQCLSDAVRCLESAKQNDSIAYLRFRFRDPRLEHSDSRANAAPEVAVVESDTSGYSPPDVPTDTDMSLDGHADSSATSPEPQPPHPRHHQHPLLRLAQEESSGGSRTSSDESNTPHSHEAIFGERRADSSSSSSASVSPHSRSPLDGHSAHAGVELEAVISCTSDGLVVCLREARQSPPVSARPWEGAHSTNDFSGAVPWSTDPIMPSWMPSTPVSSPGPRHADRCRTPDLPDTLPHPSSEDFMTSIRDCAVFAWGLTGINGTLAAFGSGEPRGEAQPPAGVAIWDPMALDGNVPDPVSAPHVDQLASVNLVAGQNNFFHDPSARGVTVGSRDDQRRGSGGHADDPN